MKNTLNIILGILMAVTAALLVWAIATAGSEAAISVNLIWGYVLLVGAVLSVVYCAVKGMIKNPAGIGKTIASIAIIVVVIGIGLGVALSHKGLAIPNSAGGVFDDPFELVITESSIIVTYVAFVVTILAALFSEIRNALK